MVRVTLVPFSPRIFCVASVAVSPLTDFPSTCVIISCGRKPAFSAGEFLIGETITIAPSFS